MKIRGPDGSDPTGPVTEKISERAGEVNGPQFDELLQARAEPTEAAGAPTLVEQISQQIQAGKLGGAEAAEQLIEVVVRQKLESLAPALRERVSAELRRLLTEDPVLADKINKLSGG